MPLRPVQGLLKMISKSTSVGLAGRPDREGITTLDACIMDEFYNCGSVCFLEKIKHPISVARKVMETTPHVMLAGSGAQQFALENGFELDDYVNPESEKAWHEWLKTSEYKPIINLKTTTPSALWLWTHMVIWVVPAARAAWLIRSADGSEIHLSSEQVVCR